MREKRAKHLGVDPTQIAETWRTSEVRLQKCEKLRDVARIGFARRRALSALIDEMRQPILDRALEVAAER